MLAPKIIKFGQCSLELELNISQPLGFNSIKLPATGRPIVPISVKL